MVRNNKQEDKAPINAGNSREDDEDYVLYGVFFRTNIAMTTARESELSKFGISPAEASVIFIIYDNNNYVTPPEIAKKTLRRTHSVHELLNRMEKKGLITKTRDLNRKNVWRVSLTDAGIKAYEQSEKRESIRAIFSTCTKREKKQLTSILTKIRDQSYIYQITNENYGPL